MNKAWGAAGPACPGTRHISQLPSEERPGLSKASFSGASGHGRLQFCGALVWKVWKPGSQAEAGPHPLPGQLGQERSVCHSGI